MRYFFVTDRFDFVDCALTATIGAHLAGGSMSWGFVGVVAAIAFLKGIAKQ